MLQCFRLKVKKGKEEKREKKHRAKRGKIWSPLNNKFSLHTSPPHTTKIGKGIINSTKNLESSILRLPSIRGVKLVLL